MEQVVTVEFDGMTHSRLHEKGDDHKHQGNKTEVTLVFDEKKALGLLAMDTDGRFNFDTRYKFVEVNDDGSIKVDDGIRINAVDELYALVKPEVKRADNWNWYDLLREIRNKAARERSTKVEINDLLDHIREMKALEDLVPAAIEDAQRRQDEARPRYEAYLAKKKAEAEAEKKAEAERQAEFNRKKAEAEAKVEAWIQENGSERLKLGRKEGHKCRKLLISEIVAKEFPGAVLDYNEWVSDKDRSCPTLEALKRLDDLRKNPWTDDVGIFWLPYGLSEVEEEIPGDCYPDASEACEAIRIRIDIGEGGKNYAYLLV